MNAQHKVESTYEIGAAELKRRLGIHPKVHPEQIEIGKLEYISEPWTKRGGRYRIQIKTMRWL